MKKKGTAIHFAAAGAWILSALFVFAALAAVWFCRDSKPVLLAAPEDAVRQTELLMEAVCSGDFPTAEKLLYGAPDLGLEEGPEDPVGAMLWQAYVDSLDYALMGEVYPSETGVVQDVKFISLELNTLTEKLGIRAEKLLEEAVAQARDVSELYDENNQYKESLLRAVLEEAARQALEEDVRYTYQTVPVQWVCRDGQWLAVADRTFLRALSGGITG